MNNDAAAPTLVALPADLLFAARIRDAALNAGVHVSLARSVKQVSALMTTSTRSLFVDLDSRSGDPVALIAEVKREHPQVRVLAFVSHVREDAISAAREAGADQVLARSAFVKRLPELLSTYA